MACLIGVVVHSGAGIVSKPCDLLPGLVRNKLRYIVFRSSPLHNNRFTQDLDQGRYQIVAHGFSKSTDLKVDGAGSDFLERV